MDERIYFSVIIAVAAGAGILLSIFFDLLEITLFGVLSGVVATFALAYFIGGTVETAEKRSN